MMHNFYIRKGIHLVSGYMFIWITRYDNMAIYLTGCWVFFSLLIDILRNHSKFLSRLFYKIFGRFLTSDENEGKITGATTLWSGLFIIYLFFPYNIFYPAACVMVFSDALAALFGKTFKTFTFKNGKTIGGSVMFLCSSVFIFWYANIPLILGFPYAIILSIVELFWQGSWENIAIGFGAAVSLSFI